MKKRLIVQSWAGALMMPGMALILGVLLIPVPAYAVVDCAMLTAENGADSDGDGFTDFQECTGITLFDGSTFPGYLNRMNLTREKFLDPNSKDLFVILVKAPGSTWLRDGVNWLEFLPVPLSKGGLAITIHVITPQQADPYRKVCGYSPQLAVRITESLDPGTTDQQKKTFGLAEWGTPNGLDDATVWTQRIVNFVTHTICATNFGQTSCKDSATGVYGQALIDRYIKSVIAHEIGHTMKLTGIYTSTYGGYHYKSGTGVEMDQSVAVKGTTFNVGTTYKSTDQIGFRLIQ